MDVAGEWAPFVGLRVFCRQMSKCLVQLFFSSTTPLANLLEAQAVLIFTAC